MQEKSEKNLTKSKLYALYCKTIKDERIVVIIKGGKIIIRKEKSMSKRFQFNKENLKRVGKVILYSGISAAIVATIGVLKELDVPTEWVWAVTVSNTILYALKEFFTAQK